MARAGASLVQLYTSFGYRGVGTPRLIKDEISADLAPRRLTWKSEIGKDWAGKEMGWDEKRLRKESKALQKEAYDLGEILRKSFEEEDTARLIKEAEAALGGSRDNLAGGTPGLDPERKEEVKQALQGLVGSRATTTESAEPPASGSQVVDETKPEKSIEVSGPLGGLLGPVVVRRVEEVAAAPRREPDEWSGSVKSGQKRLV